MVVGIQVNLGSERLGGVDHCLIFDMVRYNLAGHPRDVLFVSADMRNIFEPLYGPSCEVFFFFFFFFLLVLET